jgi:Ca-activated chloride channel family protein
MQFYHSEWLYGLWSIPLVILFFWWTGKKKNKMTHLFAREPMYKMLSRSHSVGKEKIKKGAVLVVLGLLFIALAQPQWGEEKKEVKRRGIEAIFLVDTSLSMLAEDIAPSRIQKSRLLMKSFLRILKGDRVGIVTFAGSGFIQSPLTLDYDAFLLFANSIQVGYIPDAGTSLGQAIRMAAKAFEKSKQKTKVAILLTDGEDLEGEVDSALKMAQEAKVRIYTIGIGTKEGAPIPLRSENKKISGYKKDRAGDVVITKLNEDLLTKIANETGGLYVAATPGEKEVDWIYKHLQNLDKDELKQRLIVERENHFQLFLGLALMVMILEMLMNEATKEKAQYAN